MFSKRYLPIYFLILSSTYLYIFSDFEEFVRYSLLCLIIINFLGHIINIELMRELRKIAELFGKINETN